MSAPTVRMASRSCGSTKRRFSMSKPMWMFAVSTRNAGSDGVRGTATGVTGREVASIGIRACRAKAWPGAGAAVAAVPAPTRSARRRASGKWSVPKVAWDHRRVGAWTNP